MATNDEKPIISVIIPTFRRPQLLKRAIDSILVQTYPHFQICIYDDASNDETSQIVSQYREDRIKYHVHSKNIGMNKNYNFALEQVDTPFFVFLSDDDLFLPFFLEEGIKRFEQHPDAGIFTGGAIFIDKKKRMIRVISYGKEYGYYSSREFIIRHVRGHFDALINSMIFRREVRDKIGLFNDRIWLDIDFVTRALLEFPVISSPMACIIYQLHSNISNKTIMNEYWEMKNSMRDLMLKSDMWPSDERNEMVTLTHLEMKRFMHSIIHHKFVSFHFSESLKGIEILQQHYRLNKQEAMVKWVSRILLKFHWLVYFFAGLVTSIRLIMRIFHFRKSKKILGEDNYRSFKDLVTKI